MQLRPIIASVFLCFATAAFAHDGTRVFVANDGGTLRTYAGNNNQDSTQFSPATIFAQPMVDEDGFDSFSVDFPGFQVNEQVGGIPRGINAKFGFNIAGPLRFFDYDSIHRTGFFPTVAQYFPPDGDVPQIAISPSSTSTGSTKITGAGPVTGFNFFTYNAPGDHGHVFFNLSPDGVLAGNVVVNPGGPAGVYALPLQLTGPAATSPTFWILFGYQVPADQLGDAYDAASFWGLDLGRNPGDIPGDANGDLLINADDYARTDRGFLKHLSGWMNGDFDGDRAVTAADYLILDIAFAKQSGGQLPNDLLMLRETQFGSSYVAQLAISVPEPTALASLLLAGFSVCRPRPSRTKVIQIT